MAHVAIYLNFMGNAEEAFNHYKKFSEQNFPLHQCGLKTFHQGKEFYQ
jgi:hypothetical protein